jgi:hypothetical protein
MSQHGRLGARPGDVLLLTFQVNAPRVSERAYREVDLDQLPGYHRPLRAQWVCSCRRGAVSPSRTTPSRGPAAGPASAAPGRAELRSRSRSPWPATRGGSRPYSRPLRPAVCSNYRPTGERMGWPRRGDAAPAAHPAAGRALDGPWMHPQLVGDVEEVERADRSNVNTGIGHRERQDWNG